MKVSKGHPSRSKSLTLNHQANGYLEFKRGSGVGSRAKLKVVLALPPTSSGAAASVLVYKNGVVTPITLRIPSNGDGTFKVQFGTGVSKVDVVLTNGSTRYKASTCYSYHSPYACGGAKPVDDGKTYKVTAKL